MIKLMKLEHCSVKREQEYLFNGIDTNNSISLYITSHNRLDVAIMFRNTVLCGFEVHSSPYIYTLRKLIYGLVQLLRIVKGYQITDCALIGFALPKLGIKRYAMEVKVEYNTDLSPASI